jgi:hypothetical protein
MNTQEKINSNQTPTGAETNPQEGLSEEGIETFNSEDMIDIDSFLCELREFITNKNIKIKSMENLLVAAFKCASRPNRMACWQQISEGLDVDYGLKTLSLFGSRTIEYDSVEINTDKNKVVIDLTRLEDVEYLANFLGRECNKHTTERGAEYWSVEREWHSNSSQLHLQHKSYKPEVHHQHDFFEITCWIH